MVDKQELVFGAKGRLTTIPKGNDSLALSYVGSARECRHRFAAACSDLQVGWHHHSNKYERAISMSGHQRPGSGRIAMASRLTLNLVFPGQYAEPGTHYPRYCDPQTAAPQADEATELRLRKERPGPGWQVQKNRRQTLKTRRIGRQNDSKLSTLSSIYLKVFPDTAASKLRVDSAAHGFRQSGGSTCHTKCSHAPQHFSLPRCYANRPPLLKALSPALRVGYGIAGRMGRRFHSSASRLSAPSRSIPLGLIPANAVMDAAIHPYWKMGSCRMAPWFSGSTCMPSVLRSPLWGPVIFPTV